MKSYNATNIILLCSWDNYLYSNIGNTGNIDNHHLLLNLLLNNRADD